VDAEYLSEQGIRPVARSISEIVNRFNEQGWHDSPLLAFAATSNDAPYVVEMEFDLIKESILIDGHYHDHYLRQKLRLINCYCIKMEAYLDCHRAAQYQIYGAVAKSESDWKSQIARDETHYDFSKHIHFHFELCPQFGTIDILATEFEQIPIPSDQE